MIRPTNYPTIILVFSFLLLWLAGSLGASIRRKRKLPDQVAGADPGLILGATLTLLGLIIGFTFSMAVSRYEQRKNYEEAEANAIGTEYVRADLLPAADAQRVRGLLANYTTQRILFYTTHDEQKLGRVNANTAQLQTDLWSAVAKLAAAQPTAITALVVSGMNDVLNSQGYTQAAWWNRIPPSAWALMFTDRSLLQSVDRLLHSPRWYGTSCVSGDDPGGVDLVLSYRRHRQPTPRHYSGAAAKSHEPLSVAPSTMNIWCLLKIHISPSSFASTRIPCLRLTINALRLLNACSTRWIPRRCGGLSVDPEGNRQCARGQGLTFYRSLLGRSGACEGTI